MAEVLASLKKIGGNGEQYTETVLWTNPSPTADFGAQEVTLSDSISNYKYIAIKYKHDKNNSDNTQITPLISVIDFMKTSDNGNGIAFSISALNSARSMFNRNIYYVSATSIQIKVAYQQNVANNNNSVAIPLEILGINELAHGKIAPNETIFLGHYDSTSVSLTTFTLLDDLSNYRYLIMSNSQKDANGNMINDRAAVDAILSIEQLKNDGSITYHAATSNGTALNITIGYVDDTHITEQRSGSTNKGFWIYAV